MQKPDQLVQQWANLQGLPSLYYQCGYCGANVAPTMGYVTEGGTGTHEPLIYICSGCRRPTYFFRREQTPAPAIGSAVPNLPEQIRHIFEETRNCSTVGAYTCAVLGSRKLVMHISVDKGAEENLSFAAYVNFLADKGYVPPDGKEWVDQIRVQGNDANHEIVVKSQEDAEEVLGFVEMLLRFIYEFPARVRRP